MNNEEVKIIKGTEHIEEFTKNKPMSKEQIDEVREKIAHKIDVQLHLETLAAVAFKKGLISIAEYELHRDDHLGNILSLIQPLIEQARQEVVREIKDAWSDLLCTPYWEGKLSRGDLLVFWRDFWKDYESRYLGNKGGGE